MTTKRDSSKRKQDERRSAERPMLKRETLRDLTVEHRGEGVRGGRAPAETGKQCMAAGGSGSENS
jgi:hypothetical protein